MQDDDNVYEKSSSALHGSSAGIVFCILQLCGERLETQRKCMELLLFQREDGKDALLSTLSSLFDEKYEELIQELTPEMTAMDQLLFLNQELFRMIENSISLDLLARLYSTQLTTNGEKHLLDHNRIYYKLLKKIIAKGQADGQLSTRSNVNEMVKLYALCERALLYDWCLCSGEYSLVEYAAKVMPGFLSSFQP